ncbi:MAG: RDD family protein [Acidimicrobiales bacterium]
MTSPLLRPLGGTDPTNVVVRRIGAWFLDQLIGALLVLGFATLVGVGVESDTTVDSRGQTVVTGSTVQGSPGAWAAVVVVSFAYAIVTQVILVAQLGWSPGKLLVGLRVVSWDGRPPGLGRALVRGVVNWVGSWFSCLWYLPAFGFLMTTKGHRQPADMAANTYVIDHFYLGRMIVRTETGVTAGERSVHAGNRGGCCGRLGEDVPIHPRATAATERSTTSVETPTSSTTRSAVPGSPMTRRPTPGTPSG